MNAWSTVKSPPRLWCNLSAVATASGSVLSGPFRVGDAYLSVVTQPLYSPQLQEKPGQILRLVIRIQTTGIRQNPQKRIADHFLLPADSCLWLIEGCAVSA